MATAPPAQNSGTLRALTRRHLLLRDGVTFLALFAITVVLYGVTLFLFRSFQSHREELAVRWSERGANDMRAGHPDAAVTAMRAALSYAPDNRSFQLLLAQALAAAGHTDEAASYFLNLWETRPGDGFINLELARLDRRKGETSQATEYYRAAIFGAWQGSGLIHRRNVRLELADYLAEQHDRPAARSELLIAAANAPDDPALAALIAAKLAAIGDGDDALTFYRRALTRDPHNRAVLEQAGRTAFSLGDYPTAHTFLRQALALPVTAGAPAAATEDLARLDAQAVRLVELSLSRNLPAHVLGRHLLVASDLAQARLFSCVAASASPQPSPTPSTAPSSSPLTAPSPAVPAAPAAAGSLADLVGKWKLAGTPRYRRALLSDGDLQDETISLVAETERRTAQVCGAPTGDDALLLRIATTDHIPDPPVASGRSLEP